VIFGTSVTDEFEAADILIVSGRDDDLRKLAEVAGRD
jgi:hypothetical protein